MHNTLLAYSPGNLLTVTTTLSLPLYRKEEASAKLGTESKGSPWYQPCESVEVPCHATVFVYTSTSLNELIIRQAPISGPSQCTRIDSTLLPSTFSPHRTFRPKLLLHMELRTAQCTVPVSFPNPSAFLLAMRTGRKSAQVPLSSTSCTGR